MKKQIMLNLPKIKQVLPNNRIRIRKVKKKQKQHTRKSAVFANEMKDMKIKSILAVRLPKGANPSDLHQEHKSV